MPDPDLARCFDFVLRADMAGTRHVPFAHGTAVFLPELPLRIDSNYLLVESLPATDPVETLLTAADDLQGAAGLPHRCLMFRDAALGEQVAPALLERGWKRFRGVVMALRRPPARVADTSRVVRTDDEALRETRTRNMLRYPWCTEEVARQLLDARSYVDVRTGLYAVFDDGAPVAWSELYLDGDVAQVESVATEPDHRDRGHGSAVVARCVEEARRAGADLVFLCADADDWPRAWYERLGFDEIGRYVKLLREPVDGAAGGAPAAR